MISTILSLLLCVIFTILSFFHFYWLFGGVWGVHKVIPTKDPQVPPLSVPKFGTLVVAITLLLFGILYLLKTGFIQIEIPHWLTYTYYAIPFIFILRAIGEFRYVGFFKKIKNTEFAQVDSLIFAPLCLWIGGTAYIVLLLS
ncbi:DUF3995 domain-containing protein [Aquimarina hainanensis]|uniref:DUF3995 domain-containing protein n=1 Tax=Aquimarina hainanensis TaxID=1578017 RepID=A0ABW5N3J1_9FLAO